MTELINPRLRSLYQLCSLELSKKEETMLKKWLINQKGAKILNEFSILLHFQYNNVSTKEWHFLKNELKQIEEVSSLVIQNKIAEKIIEKIQDSKANSLENSNSTEKKRDYRNPIKNKIENYNHQSTLSHSTLSLNHNHDYKGLVNKVDRLFIFDERVKNLFQGPTFLIGCNTIEQLKKIKNLMKNFSNFIFIGGVYKNQTISHYTLEKLVKLDESVKLELIYCLKSKLASLNFLKNNLSQKLFFHLSHCQEKKN